MRRQLRLLPRWATGARSSIGCDQAVFHDAATQTFIEELWRDEPSSWSLKDDRPRSRSGAIWVDPRRRSQEVPGILDLGKALGLDPEGAAHSHRGVGRTGAIGRSSRFVRGTAAVVTPVGELRWEWAGPRRPPRARPAARSPMRSQAGGCPTSSTGRAEDTHAG